MEIVARNVNHAYVRGLTYLRNHGEKHTSRNGPVVRSPEPVLTIYERPRERVLFSDARDANPFFHVMEGLWMLSGGRDAGRIAKFNSQMNQYANKYGNFDGAYGYRWLYHFGLNQVSAVVQELTERPDSRRAVIAMFDPRVDHNPASLDIPCNTTIYFRIRDNCLDMTVCCRSNDAVWGCYGANVVHMSMLQEVVAAKLAVGMGRYYQFSNDLHYYPDVKNHQELVNNPISRDRYTELMMPSYPLVHHAGTWDEELVAFMQRPDYPDLRREPLLNHFLTLVASPMYRAFSIYKLSKDPYRIDRMNTVLEAINIAETVEDTYWRIACCEWLNRRLP